MITQAKLAQALRYLLEWVDPFDAKAQIAKAEAALAAHEAEAQQVRDLPPEWLAAVKWARMLPKTGTYPLRSADILAVDDLLTAAPQYKASEPPAIQTTNAHEQALIAELREQNERLRAGMTHWRLRAQQFERAHEAARAEAATADQFAGVRNMVPQGPYKVERHGDGWAIYTGRDMYHHGCNWGQLSECDEALAKRIEAGLNALSIAPAAPQPPAAQPAQQPLTWQPIETAPKDGTNVLLVNRKGNIASGLWIDSLSGTGWYLRGSSHGPDVFFNGHHGPTHWMPWPATPAALAAAKDQS